MRFLTLFLTLSALLAGQARAQTFTSHGVDNNGNTVTVVVTIVPGPEGAPLLGAVAVSINGKLYGGVGYLKREAGDKWSAVVPTPRVQGEEGDAKRQDKPSGKDNPKPPVVNVDGSPSNEDKPGDQAAGSIDLPSGGRIRLYN